MMFKLFRWLFRKRIDDYIFDNTLSKVQLAFTDQQKAYLKSLSQEGMFNDIVDVFVASIVSSGMAARTPEGIAQRDNWIGCVGFIKKMINSHSPKPIQTTNPLTNEPFRTESK